MKTAISVFPGLTWRDGALRLALLAALWWALAGDDAQSWLVGVPAVLAAALVSGVLTPVVAWRWTGMATLRFVGFFVGHSIMGGIDVAWRVFHPRLPVRPGFVEVELRLPPGAGRVWLATLFSLLPGTLAVRLEDGRLLVHAVDLTAPVAENVRAVEARVAAMFGLDLLPARGGRS